MSRNQYLAIRILIIVSLAMTSAFASSSGGWWWLAIPVAVGIAFFIHLRFLSPNRVREVMNDERSRLIQEKAARAAIFIFVMAAVIIGAVLVVLTYRTDLGVDLGQAGITLVDSAVALALLVIILRFYYSRKL